MDTLFHWSLPATAMGLTSLTIAVNQYLKVKDIEYNVGLNQWLMHHSQHKKTQLNS